VSAPANQNRLLGIGLRVGAATSFGFMAAMIKLGSEAGVSVPEMAFYRFAFGLPPLLAWIAWTRDFGAWRTKRPLAHLARGAIGLSTMVLAFGALTYLPLAESATIGFVAPLFSVMLSALILSEPVGRHRWSAVALGFIGVLIVMRPSGGNLPAEGLALALLAAFGVAAVTITIRQIGRTESTPTTVLWFTLFSMAVTGALLPFFGQAHDARTWAVLAALGLFGGMGQLFLTSALRFAGGGSVRLYPIAVGGAARLGDLGHPTAVDDLGRRRRDRRQRPLHPLPRAQIGAGEGAARAAVNGGQSRDSH